MRKDIWEERDEKIPVWRRMTAVGFQRHPNRHNKSKERDNSHLHTQTGKKNNRVPLLVVLQQDG
jgi:hypothetical protein